MTATHINEITDAAISARLAQVERVDVEWTGHMPADAEEWDDAANREWPRVTVAKVRRMLAHQLDGDSAADEIDMAISIACEPATLPNNAHVLLQFRA